MTADPLGSAIVLLAASVGAMGLARSLGVSPVIGFFAAGALIGPHGIGLADASTDVLKVLAELGVCFLLFDAGLHISVSHLKKQWRTFFAVGGAQFVVVASLLATALSLSVTASKHRRRVPDRASLIRMAGTLSKVLLNPASGNCLIE